MIQKIKRKFIENIKNIPGFRTDRKLIVFESDDWGSMRVSSKDSLNRLISFGLIEGNVKSFDTLDSIESSKDLEELYKVLGSVKDKNGHHAVFTPFFITANPNFEKIKAENFNQYYYEDFKETFRKYSDSSVFKYYLKGIQEKIFMPELHGREHLNIYEWMYYLQNNHNDVRKGFKENFSAVKIKDVPYYISGFRNSFYFRSFSQIPLLSGILKDACRIFYESFGYKASVFDAPNAVFHPKLEQVLFVEGIKNIVLQRFRPEPDGKGGVKKNYYGFGQKNSFGQIYHIRNCVFEPSLGKNDNLTFSMIKSAFRWKKPAVISSHRVNYMSGFDNANRDSSLESLNKLLKKIIKIFPEVEFISSAQLSQLMHQSL